MDFIFDGLANGRVTRVLDRLIKERGRPESVRSDNGPEFTSRRMLGWTEEKKIALAQQLRETAIYRHDATTA